MERTEVLELMGALKLYLWAPISGSGGVVFTHWSNMTLVQPGDIIFSYARQSIGAIAVASNAAYDAPQPIEFEGGWNTDGRRIDVVYRTLEPEVPLRDFVDELVPLLPDRNSPITKLKEGVQGYLFAIPPKKGQLICDQLEFVAPIEQLVAETLTQTVMDETTRQALILARLGQGRWRGDLLRHWSGRCAVPLPDKPEAAEPRPPNPVSVADPDDPAAASTRSIEKSPS